MCPLPSLTGGATVVLPGPALSGPAAFLRPCTRPGRKKHPRPRNYHVIMRTGLTGARSTSSDALLTLWGILALIAAFGLFVLLIPIALGLAVAAVSIIAVLWVVAWVRVKLARARRPNGAFDKRRNVRVRVPGESNRPQV